jgi:dienelactone hydrolase
MYKGHFKALIACAILFIQTGVALAQTNYPSTAKVAADFKAMLQRPLVAASPSFTISKTNEMIIERGTINSEAGEKVPTLIYKPATGQKKYPVVIFSHGTGGRKDSKEITDVLAGLVKLGIMGVAIDARFHGERIKGGAHGSEEYVNAAYAAWKNTDPAKQTHPFLYDTSYDLWRLVDYLATRPDVDAGRIGMSGNSMGGMETYLAAGVDKRIKVIVLNISAQSFKWSLDNDKWQGRAGTIKAAHQKAAQELGDIDLNKKNVKAVWDKIIPGITDEFDCPSMIRLLAPRPTLVLSNENDQNCPLPGALIAFDSAKAAFATQNAIDNLKMDIEPNEPHRATPKHLQMTLDWFAKLL